MGDEPPPAFCLRQTQTFYSHDLVRKPASTHWVKPKGMLFGIMCQVAMDGQQDAMQYMSLGNQRKPPTGRMIRVNKTNIRDVNHALRVSYKLVSQKCAAVLGIKTCAQISQLVGDYERLWVA